MQKIKLAFFHILLTIASIAIAQESFSKNDIRVAMWGQPNKEFSTTQIPEKWASEDAVIIASFEERSYQKPPISAFLYEQNAIHVRVKILSNSALADYSQFEFKKNTYFRGTSLETYVGFKIIKPDGRAIIIDENEAVEEDLELNSSTKLTTLKLAIPNLEVGDIIDYYIVEKYKFPTTKYHTFDPAIFLLREKYPLMYGKIRFKVLRRCYINLKTYNGAPNFTKLNDGDNDIYELEYRDQDKVDPVPYFYPYRSLPTIKFKVTYASPGIVHQAPNLLKKSHPGHLNTSVSEKDISNYLRSLMSNIYGIGNLQKYMKANYKGEKDKIVLVKEAFYHQRHMLSVQFQENWTIRGNSSYIALRRAPMIKSLSSYFKKANIPHSFIVGVPAQIGTVNNIIIEEEMLLGIRANTNPPIYITSFTTHSLVNELDENFDGASVLISSNVNDIGPLTFESKKLPQSPFDRNEIFTINDATVDLESMKSRISITKSFSGLTRFDEQRNLMDAFDFVDEERDKYDLKSFLEDLSKIEEKETRNLLREYMRSREEKLNEKLLEKTKANLDIDIDTVHSFRIFKTGRNQKNPEFQYDYVAETDDLLKKVGNNYLLSIGSLIEKQQVVENEYKEDRTFDIYMNYPRKFHNQVSLIIPEGYTIKGLDKLNVNVQNETGGFISVASIEENKLIINAMKYYRNSFEPAENWGKLLAFITTADDFNDVQVLLKKN
ncbi:DUF3857 domain-containing protein [Ekhidna sp.]